MNAPNYAAIGPPAIAVATVLGMIVLATCEGLPPTEATADPPVVCNGQPDWCLVARSELEGRRPAYVYLDGELKKLVLPGTTVRIPVTSGASRVVNFCGFFEKDAGETKEWMCSTPTSVRFVNGDETLVISPLYKLYPRTYK